MPNEKQIKRLNFEIKNDFDSNTVIWYDHNNQDKIYIQDFMQQKSIEIELSKGWPFYPIKNVWINNKSVKISHPIPSKLFLRYRKKCSLKCPCCDVLILGKNWNPTIRIKQIIDQYAEVLGKFRTLYYDEWFNRLFTKDIPIEIKNIVKSYLC